MHEKWNGGVTQRTRNPATLRSFVLPLALMVVVVATPFEAPTDVSAADISIIERRVSSGPDDAEEGPSGVDISATRLSLTELRKGRNVFAQMVGLRFTDLGIPPGSVVERAHVVFRAAQKQNWDPARFEIRAEASIDSKPFMEVAGDISDRPTTTSSVIWEPEQWNARGETHRTPDISVLVQEIIDRPGWTGGNAISLVVKGFGTRIADAFDGQPDGAPLLHVEYVAPNKSPNASFTFSVDGLDATFADTSTDPDGAIVSRLWDFGDGTTSTSQTPTHTYTEYGSYDVTLTVTDDDAAIGRTSRTIDLTPPPANEPVTVAFFGDSGMWGGFQSVLDLAISEGADLILHLGDFDYVDDPTGFFQAVESSLGPSYPFLAVIGNHDVAAWEGPNGYGALLADRAARYSDVECIGDLGVQAACTFKGILFVLSGIGTSPTTLDDADHVEFIERALADADASMRICAWHKNQATMQVGAKTDEVGWMAYEACREAGAMVVTGHSHTYSRTHLIDDYPTPTVASEATSLILEPGTSITAVSGLGGLSVRPQLRDDPWWASIYTADQDATFGALFCTFFVGGDPQRSDCYFKDVNGVVADTFEIVSAVNAPIADFDATPISGDAPLSVVFDASSSRSPSGSTLSYRWDFGDGTTATGATSTHLYERSGTFAASLTVTDAAGLAATSTQTILVTSSTENDAPIGRIYAHPAVGTPLSIEFDASASYDPDGTIVNYAWDFGDGSQATGVSVTHTFTQPGDHLVTLTVTDDAGENGVDDSLVSVRREAIQVRVGASADDAEEANSGLVVLNSSDLELVDEGSWNTGQTVGIRFSPVNIPPGALIEAAHIQFQVDEPDDSDTALTIEGEAAGDSPPFSAVAYDISSRARTTVFADWSPVPWIDPGVSGPAQRTPDLTAIVQEIVGRPDWRSGNGLTIIVTGIGRRTAESFEGFSAGAPLISVDFVYATVSMTQPLGVLVE